MTKYEQLLDEASEKNITVVENYDLTGTQLKGLYCDCVVAIGNKILPPLMLNVPVCWQKNSGTTARTYEKRRNTLE